MKTLLDEAKIKETIKRIRRSSFTVIDFIEVFRTSYPSDWKRLVERFGQFGQKRRYTVTTYLSNRLDLCSRKAGSLLLSFTTYSEARFKDYRSVTEQERKQFGGTHIAVFRRRKARAESRRRRTHMRQRSTR